jgi:hypothetical protein
MRVTIETRRGRPLALTTLLLFVAVSPALPFTIDPDGDARVGVRAYNAVRVGTEGFEDLSFPPSYAGNLRQHRYFLEVEFNHNLMRMMEETNGPVGLLRRLPFPIDRLGYNLVYRGEGEGLYDYGPKAYTTFDNYRHPPFDLPEALVPSQEDLDEFGDEFQRRMRRLGRQRHRLFQAYLDVESGPVFLRIGRQNLSWGETDNFRLLDNINPLDNGFGGVFIDLDERRIPLDMLRANVAVPDWGPFTQNFVEAFGAFGDQVSHEPGIPTGSPWNPGGLNYPLVQLRTTRLVPDLDAFRGGARVVFNVRDITFSAGHYWTYLDTPGVKLHIPPSPLDNPISINNRIIAIQRAPRVPISGASMTFAVPKYYSVVRSEFAYFYGEPANCEGIGTPSEALHSSTNPDPKIQQGLRRLSRNLNGCLDPFRMPSFLLNPKQPIDTSYASKDSVNAVVGLDMNRYLRWLNPTQSIFFSTQFFYKHIVDAFPDQVLPVLVRIPTVYAPDSPTLPFNERIVRAIVNGRNQDRQFAKVYQNQFLHTLRVQTSYRGGTIQPQMTVFYDWTGIWLYQPAVRFVRDPYRLLLEYTGVSGVLGGQVGLVRDRDNVRIQVEVSF